MTKKHILFTATLLFAAPFSIYSTSASFTIRATAIGNYEIGDNFDFSSIPLTEENSQNIKIYNLDDFIVKETSQKSKSDLEGLGLKVGIQRYKEENSITVKVVYQ